MPNPYSPAVAEGETPGDLWFERSLFDGMALESVAYGVHLTIFFITAYYLLLKPLRGKISWPWTIYIFLLFTCGTINAACGIKFSEKAWIDDRDIPGGPLAYNKLMYSDVVLTLGNASYILANFLADGILLWRCFVLYNRSYFLMIIPFLAFLASTTLSVLTIYQTSQPNASIWSHSAIIIGVPYWALSISLTIVVTSLIIFRLLWHRHTTGKTLGPGHAATYSAIAVMFVESAAMYTITGIFYIICFARNSTLQNLLLGVLGQAECIAPELIVLRVALGHTWSTSISADVSTNISFRKGRSPASNVSDPIVDIPGTESSAITRSIGSHVLANSISSEMFNTEAGSSQDVPKTVVNEV